MLLALDTATSCVSVAVHHDGQVLAEVTHEDNRRHGELLAPAVSAALARAGVTTRDLAAVVCGVGPGPFTGLRVGVVTARVLGHAAGIPVHGVCSLDAIAWAGAGSGLLEGDVLVATDARRKEVYWARYAVSDGRARRLAGPEVARAADLPAELRGLPCLGRGPTLYPDALIGVLGEDGQPPEGTVDVRAGALAATAARALADGDPQGVLLDPDPLYLRRPDAVVPGPLKQALPPPPPPRGQR